MYFLIYIYIIKLIYIIDCSIYQFQDFAYFQEKKEKKKKKGKQGFKMLVSLKEINLKQKNSSQGMVTCVRLLLFSVCLKKFED